MSALGLMTSSIPAVQWARFHQRILQKFHLEDLKGRDLEERMTIRSRVKRSLWWWNCRENLQWGVHWVLPISCILTTDASSWGWGANLNDHCSQGRWTPKERKFSSNWRELMTVSIGLLAFQDQIQGVTSKSAPTTERRWHTSTDGGNQKSTIDVDCQDYFSAGKTESQFLFRSSSERRTE